jgi:hypothetical protein
VTAGADTGVGIGWQRAAFAPANVEAWSNVAPEEVTMWSRRVLLATMVAAAAVTLTRHAPATAPGFAQAPSSVIQTSYR